MKTGIELILQERSEQLFKHDVSTQDDFQRNNERQLTYAAKLLISTEKLITMVYENPPKGWNKHIWKRLLDKPYKERLVIAAALIAAEIDRLQIHEELEKIIF